MRRTLLVLLRVGVGIGLLAYLVHAKIIDLRQLSKLIWQWPISVAAMAIFLLDFGLMASRLCLLLRPHGMRMSFRTSFQLTLVSSFFSTFLPGRAGGDIARVFYASKDNKSLRAEIVTVLLFDRALGLFSLLMLPLLMAPLFGDLLSFHAVRLLLATSAFLAFIMLVFFFLFLFMPPALKRLVRYSGNSQGWRGVPARFVRTLAAYSRSPGTLAAALAIALTDNLMVIAVTALALLIVNPASVTPKLSIVVPMGEILNSLPITPGGLGVGEAAFDALFKIVGLRGGAEALLCWRIWNIVVSLAGLPPYLRGFRARVFDSESGDAQTHVPARTS